MQRINLDRLGTILRLPVALLGLLFALNAASAPSIFVYQGRIVGSNGQPLEYSAVAFEFSILSPDGSCVLYKEQIGGIDMRNSKGVFETAIGTGTKSYPASPSFTLLDAFNNNNGSLTCSGGVTYTPLASDGRVLRVQFFDGNGWKIINPDSVIRSVPFAGFAVSAQKLGNKSAADFILKPTTCNTGEVVTYDGTGFVCTAGSGGGGSGTVTNIATGAGLTGGPITVTGTVSLAPIADKTIMANISGSLAAATGTSISAFIDNAISNTQGSILYRNNSGWVALPPGTNGQFLQTQGASANPQWAAAATSGSSVAGDVSGTLGASSVDKIKGKTVAATTYATGQVLRYDGTNWVNALIDLSSDVTGTLAVARGGTGATSIGSGNLVIGGGTGAVTSLAAGSAGNVLYATGVTSWASGSADTAGLVDKTTTQTITGAKAFSNYIQMNAQNELRLADADSSNYVALKAPGTVGTNVTLTFPATAGANGEVLTTNGSGVLSWSAPSGGGSQWTTSGSDIYYSNGHVGIGTNTVLATSVFQVEGSGNVSFNTSGSLCVGCQTSPSAKLHVNGDLQANTIRAGDGSSVANFSTDSAKAMTFTPDGTERMRISPGGNVAIGTTTSSNGTRLYVNGQIASSAGSISNASVDFSVGNAVTTTFDCSSAFSLANVRDGGSYTLVVTSTNTTQCTFPTSTTGDDAASVTYKWKTANAVRTASTHTIYTLLRVGTVIYISWATGFQ